MTKKSVDERLHAIFSLLTSRGFEWPIARRQRTHGSLNAIWTLRPTSHIAQILKNPFPPVFDGLFVFSLFFLFKDPLKIINSLHRYYIVSTGARFFLHPEFRSETATRILKSRQWHFLVVKMGGLSTS
jgi:hypothetical protein